MVKKCPKKLNSILCFVCDSIGDCQVQLIMESDVILIIEIVYLQHIYLYYTVGVIYYDDINQFDEL